MIRMSTDGEGNSSQQYSRMHPLQKGTFPSTNQVGKGGYRTMTMSDTSTAKKMSGVPYSNEAEVHLQVQFWGCLFGTFIQR